MSDKELVGTGPGSRLPYQHQLATHMAIMARDQKQSVLSSS